MQRMGMSPVGKVYVVRTVLQNVNTCLYGNIISAIFDMEPGNIRDYFQQKKNCIKNIFILRKYIFLYIFHVFFAHCLKYENNKKPDKTKLQSSTNLFFKLSQKKILKNVSVKVKKIKKLLEI